MQNGTSFKNQNLKGVFIIMNDLMNKVVQTPIEIALGIDENGMTTAKKLYEFLGMDLKTIHGG